MKIGVGIVTYDRINHFNDLLKNISTIDFDDIIIVKDYSNNNYKTTDYNFVSLKKNKGVGYCKQYCLNYLREKKCTDIFLIEDDIILKNKNVFLEYIKVSKKHNIPHLMFAHADSSNPLKLKSDYIEFYEHCRGSFMYITREALNYNFDLNFYNALEHVDYYQQLSINGLVPPLYWFPDIKDSKNYITDNVRGTSSTIKYKKTYNDKLINAFTYWKNKWGWDFQEYIKKDKNNIKTLTFFLYTRTRVNL